MSPAELALLGVGNAGAFDPLSLSPHVWFKADALSLNDGDSVGTWTDSSGNGRNATQATAAQKPTYKTNILNGRPVVRFDGTDDRLATAAWTALSQPTTILIVASYDSSTAFKQYFDGLQNGNRHAFADGLNAGGNHGIYAGSGVVEASQAKPVSAALWTLVFNGTSSSMRKNLASFASGATNIGSNTLTGLRLGTERNDSSQFLQGDIAEIILVNRALTTTERDNTETYLKAKWGTP